MAMTVNLTTKLDGSLTTSNQYHNIIFSTPGSLNSASDPTISPTYIEVPGIFNQLENPTFINNWTVYFSGMFLSGNRNGYRLKEPVKWVINPSSRLAVQDAQVADVAIPSVPPWQESLLRYH